MTKQASGFGRNGTDREFTTDQSAVELLDSIIRWDDNENAVFDLHLSFGKISFDKHNRVVDRANFRD